MSVGRGVWRGGGNYVLTHPVNPDLLSPPDIQKCVRVCVFVCMFVDIFAFVNNIARVLVYKQKLLKRFLKPKGQILNSAF